MLHLMERRLIVGVLLQVYVKVNQEAEADPSIHDEARSFFKRMEDGQSRPGPLHRDNTPTDLSRTPP